MKRIVTVTGVVVILTLLTANEAKSPLPQPKKVVVNKQWTIDDSKIYARHKLNSWTNKQWTCLVKLWYNESRWNHKSVNRKKVNGKHAGGIPQVLGMSPTLHPTKQIEQGLSYIYNRYGTPCSAWEHEKRKGWY